MPRICRPSLFSNAPLAAWQAAHVFDRERAVAALEYLRRRYGEPESRLWERHDELFSAWLAFRLADEFEAYLRSGAGEGGGG